MTNVKHKLSALLIVMLMSLGFAVLALPGSPVQAATPIDCPDGYQTTLPNPTAEAIQQACRNHQFGGPGNDEMEERRPLQAECTATSGLNQGNCGIIKYVVIAIDALSAAVGIVVVTMIAVGGVQYASSKDNPQATAAAKQRILNAIIALVVYIFMVAGLNYLIPGGLF